MRRAGEIIRVNWKWVTQYIYCIVCMIPMAYILSRFIGHLPQYSSVVVVLCRRRRRNRGRLLLYRLQWGEDACTCERISFVYSKLKRKEETYSAKFFFELLMNLFLGHYWLRYVQKKSQTNSVKNEYTLLLMDFHPFPRHYFSHFFAVANSVDSIFFDTASIIQNDIIIVILCKTVECFILWEFRSKV